MSKFVGDDSLKARIRGGWIKSVDKRRTKNAEWYLKFAATGSKRKRKL